MCWAVRPPTPTEAMMFGMSAHHFHPHTHNRVVPYVNGVRRQRRHRTKTMKTAPNQGTVSACRTRCLPRERAPCPGVVGDKRSTHMAGAEYADARKAPAQRPAPIPPKAGTRGKQPFCALCFLITLIYLFPVLFPARSLCQHRHASDLCLYMYASLYLSMNTNLDLSLSRSLSCFLSLLPDVR